MNLNFKNLLYTHYIIYNKLKYFLFELNTINVLNIKYI